MSRRVEWAKRAVKEVVRLDKPTRNRIVAAVEALATTHQGDVRRLEGRDDESFRLRVGDWRVIFSFQGDGGLLVLRVRPRGDAYKD